MKILSNTEKNTRRIILKDIKKDATYYKKSFEKIENKFQINNDPPEVVADRLIAEFGFASETI